MNTKLESHRLEPMTDLVKDFSNGVKLIEVCPLCIFVTGMRGWMKLTVSLAIGESPLDGIYHRLKFRRVLHADLQQEIMSETSLGRYNKKPVMRVQKAEVSRSMPLFSRELS